jgi:pSer/pThr/pTyr-binding forkhead associated (FHA) protein
MDTTLTLHVVSGPLAGEDYSVTPDGSCVIGRSQDCGLTLPHTPTALVASRRHCRVEVTPAGAFVRDLGSRNGTFLNGARIGRRPTDWGALDWSAEGTSLPLAHGDELRVGDTVFRVAIAAARAAELLTAAAQ